MPHAMSSQGNMPEISRSALFFSPYTYCVMCCSLCQPSLQPAVVLFFALCYSTFLLCDALLCSVLFAGAGGAGAVDGRVRRGRAGQIYRSLQLHQGAFDRVPEEHNNKGLAYRLLLPRKREPVSSFDGCCFVTACIALQACVCVVGRPVSRSQDSRTTPILWHSPMCEHNADGEQHEAVCPRAQPLV